MLHGCISQGNDRRTQIAIRRFAHQAWKLNPYANVDDEQFRKEGHALWRAKNTLGCKSCGVYRKFGNTGRCRRCKALQVRIRDVEREILYTIPLLLDQPNQIRRMEIKCLKQGKKTLQQIRELLTS